MKVPMSRFVQGARSTPAMVLYLALLTVTAGQGEIRSATVVVEGMACPFCAYGVEKRLQKVDGVETVAVSSHDGVVTLDAADGRSLAVAQIPAAVRKAGFSPGVIRMEVIGYVSLSADRDTVLVEHQAEIELSTRALEQVLAERLHRLADRRAVIRLEGEVRILVNGRLAFFPETLTPIPE